MFFSGCSTNYCATLRLQTEKKALSYNLMFHLPEFISQQITISRAIFHFRNYAVKNNYKNSEKFIIKNLDKFYEQIMDFTGYYNDKYYR